MVESSMDNATMSLNKEMIKLINRIERIFVPSNSVFHSSIGKNLDSVRQKLQTGSYYRDLIEMNVNFGKIVEWSQFMADVVEATNENNLPDFSLPAEVLEEVEIEKGIQRTKLDKFVKKERIRKLQLQNNQPALPGRWRKEPFASRKYEKLQEYEVTNSIDPEEAKILIKHLETPLNGFLGQAYNYDDHCLTEEWMVSFKDRKGSSASEDQVIRTQLESLLEIMMVQVQDRVCTECGVLEKDPVGLGDRLKECPVWGIDCYTRKMVELVLEKQLRFNRVLEKNVTIEGVIKRFVTKKLLPAINQQSPELAHNMLYAAQFILQSLNSSDIDRFCADKLIGAIEEYGIDVFRIHPKGTGVICTDPAGIPPHTFISEYLGEMYPAYRWCERMDVVEQAQKQFELKPTLPDFYNILLERPRQDPHGYGLLYVDASQKANMGSSCSHSCASNCTSAVVARNGKLVIALTTNREVLCGEELTMDYYSITTSDVEWRAAICLCGMAECRGSFLHFATQNDLQQVLNQNCGPLYRYASLLRSCCVQKTSALSENDQAVLDRHGMGKASGLDSSAASWVRRYVADILRFVEYERKALPCALMRPRPDGSPSFYSFGAADMDARSVMEQRIQSIVCCFSMLHRVIGVGKRGACEGEEGILPVAAFTPGKAALEVYERLSVIPGLIERHFLNVSNNVSNRMSLGEVSDKKENQFGLLCSDRVELSVEAISHYNRKKKVNSSSTGNSKGSNKNRQKDLGTEEMAPPESSTVEGTCAVQLKDRRKIVETLVNVVGELKKLLWEAREIKHLGQMKSLCLTFRAILLGIEHLSLPTARLGQLADVLALIANTSNFSFPQEFEEVESGPITVVARDLGTNVPRSVLTKLLKPEGGARRNRNQKEEKMSHSSTVTTEESDVGDEVGLGLITANVDTERPMVSDLHIYREGSHGASPATSLETSSETIDNAEEPILETIVREVLDECVVSALKQGAPMKTGSFVTENKGCEGSVEGVKETQNSAGSILFPDESVFVGTKKYESLFAFWGLINWFDAGTDQKIESPNLFGCVELPAPEQCFGRVENVYGTRQREMLFETLMDEKKHILPWPTTLKDCFSAKASEGNIPRKVLYGTPMLDEALGQVGAMRRTMDTLFGFDAPFTNSSSQSEGEVDCSGNEVVRVWRGSGVTAELEKKYRESSVGGGKSSKGRGKKTKEEEDHTQFDNILPPELPTNWVQCESCRKWRRVPWHIDMDSLPDLWSCELNTWEPEVASCSVKQDTYDPDVESTLQFQQTEGCNPRDDNVVVGAWRDVFCNMNKIYYEAQIRKIKPSKNEGEPVKVLFHFKGWSAKFDEWIPADSDRIHAHNLHTDPSVSDPRLQEKWQGFKHLDTSVVTKKPGRKCPPMEEGGKKRKSVDGVNGGSKKSKTTTKRMKSM